MTKLALRDPLREFFAALRLHEVVPVAEFEAGLVHLEAEIERIALDAYAAQRRGLSFSEAATDYVNYPQLARLHAAMDDILTMSLPPPLIAWVKLLVSMPEPPSFDGMRAALVAAAADQTAVNQPSLISNNKRTMATPDGTAIDQGDGGNTANTNPLYAVENPAPPAARSATLTDVGPDASFGAHGHRKKKPDGTFDTKIAELDDTARRPIAFAGQEWNAKFEVAALVLEGPMTNTYLGTVRWGWKADAAGVASMDPAALEVVSMGAPTAGFMAAAKNWNDNQVEDSAGTKFDTVDLPLSTHHGVDPGSLDDKALLQRIRELADQLMKMDRKSVDYQQVRFESRGLAQEAVKRGTTASDSGHTLRARAGDSLWQIAERELGGGVKWTQIFALNRADILDPNRITAGQELKMPVPFRPAGP